MAITQSAVAAVNLISAFDVGAFLRHAQHVNPKLRELRFDAVAMEASHP